MTSTPERIPARTLTALCDILDCVPGDLFEPFVKMRAATTAEAPRRPEDTVFHPGQPIARPVKLVRPSEDEDYDDED